MKGYLALLLIVGGAFAFPTNFVLGQRIIWEKLYPLPEDSKVLHISKIIDSSYFALGNTYYRDFIYFGNNPRLTSFKFNSRGDSSNFRMYDDTNSFPVFCQSKVHKNHFWISGYSSGRREGVIIRKIDTDGNTLLYRFLRSDSSQPSYYNFVNQIIPTNDDGILLLANKTLVLNGRNATLEYVSRYDSLGNQMWFRTYLFSYGATTPNRIEPTNRGTFLISGSDGPDIYIHEMDSTGYPISRRVLYTHPQRYGWFDAKVWQHPEGYIVIGYAAPGGTLPRVFNGFFNLSYNKIWGGQSNLTINTPAINSDGSFWALSSDSASNIYYSRYNTDSTISRSVLINGPTQPYSRGVGNILYLGDGSAIFGGSSVRRDDPNQSQAFYLCKIDSIGLPFDPTPVVGKVASGVAISVYPNPSSGMVQVSGITQATEYEVCSLQGKVLDAGVLQPNGSISLASNVAGVYLIRVGGGVVKVVRE